MTPSSFRRASDTPARGLVLIIAIMLALCGQPALAAQSATTAKAKTASAQAHKTPVRKAKAQANAKAKAKTTARKPVGKAIRKPARRVVAAHVDDAIVLPPISEQTGLRNIADGLALKSRAVLVMDQDTGEALALKNPDVILPIASLTKLMTALVVVDAQLPMDEILEVSDDDVDHERNTYSRLAVGTRLTRSELLLLALMASENRAANALSRNYPGGRLAFLARMNLTAQGLGMKSTHFADPAGLFNGSVSTARDLQHLLSAAYEQPLIRSDSTHPETVVNIRGRNVTFVNTNRLVRNAGDDWNIELQKTGFTNEAGRCLVMQVTVMDRKLSMIFLDSNGTMTRYADATRVRKRLELEARALQAARPGTGGVTASIATSIQ